MKNKKGNVAVIAIIIVIVAITASVITWLVATKSQAPVQKETANQSAPVATQPNKQPAPEPVANQQIPQQEGYFISSKLGIKFAYSYDDYQGKLTTNENKIIYKYGGPEDLNDGQYIEVFIKENTRTIEDAILDIIEAQGKDIENCKVVNKGEYWAIPEYSVYILDLKNPNISYTKQELEEIKLADVEAKEDGGPFDGEWKKREIYNKRLIENCSEYADPLGLGTSKTSPSQFIYNNETRFIFQPGLMDPPFYQENSIEFFN
ncbi:MAG: hypothetical protein ACD_9C00268G0006 [uncultured bacterium]|nr:MAG: hypothetical protein ACD_9C00268G0006 [uncultured bacterium]